jgi:hypothetical protein
VSTACALATDISDTSGLLRATRCGLIANNGDSQTNDIAQDDARVTSRDATIKTLLTGNSCHPDMDNLFVSQEGSLIVVSYLLPFSG